MYQKQKTHPLAGHAVKLKANIGLDFQGQQMGGQDFVVEDWADNVLGKSVWMADGNPAAIEYAMRIGLSGEHIPFDNKSVYGKIGLLGHIVHDSEIEREE